MNNIFSENLIIPAIITIFLILILIQNFMLRRKLNLFFKKGGENLEEALSGQLKATEKQGKDIEKIFNSVSKLEEIARKSFQKSAVLRYNPFRNVGGDQSFTIAMLDAENNGFVISSLYAREGVRLYSKAIENGDSEYPLSEEEKKAIEQAIKSEGD